MLSTETTPTKVGDDSALSVPERGLLASCESLVRAPAGMTGAHGAAASLVNATYTGRVRGPCFPGARPPRLARSQVENGAVNGVRTRTMSQEARSLGSTVIGNGPTPSRARHAPDLEPLTLRSPLSFVSDWAQNDRSRRVRQRTLLYPTPKADTLMSRHFSPLRQFSSDAVVPAIIENPGTPPSRTSGINAPPILKGRFAVTHGSPRVKSVKLAPRSTFQTKLLEQGSARRSVGPPCHRSPTAFATRRFAGSVAAAWAPRSSGPGKAAGR